MVAENTVQSTSHSDPKAALSRKYRSNVLVCRSGMQQCIVEITEKIQQHFVVLTLWQVEIQDKNEIQIFSSPEFLIKILGCL